MMYHFIIPIIVNSFFSIILFALTIKIIPKFTQIFINSRLFGIDLNKIEENKIPEALGVIGGACYLICQFLFIPVPFWEYFNGEKSFPFHEYVQFLAALLSICCMIFLGFADDVLNLKWRHKLLLPTIASLPLLTVYFITFNLTAVVIPKPLRNFLGYKVNIGPFYYLYMGMLSVFCTNAINILAGINGVETGQSLIIAVSVICFNFIELNGDHASAHIFSLYLMLPYVAVCLALLWHNLYPAKIFVGDTFCYFSGMTFAVVAILGHFSKTMLLFFIPQVFNFLISIPQLFKLIPCPRHRMPKYNKKIDKLEMSYAKFKENELKFPGKLILQVFSKLKLIDFRVEEQHYVCSNMTILVFLLKIFGPLHEKHLLIIFMIVQIICSVFAFIIRYKIAGLLYDS